MGKPVRGVPMCTLICMCIQIEAETIGFSVTTKPVLSGHSKIEKKTILMTSVSLMKVESLAECSKGSILQYF